MVRIRLLSGLLLLLLTVSCHRQEKKKAVPDLWQAPAARVLTADTTIRHPLRGDTSLSVMVYLPPACRPDTLLPLLLFFDPHGSGTLPLEHYRSLARRYGYILAGSNSTRNGMDGKSIERVLRLTREDLLDLFPVDSRRFYAAGFSGGARVAALMALTDPTVRGVAACGGGLPATGNLPPVRFDLISFAGEEDFNLPELLQLDASLAGQPCRHTFILFPGRHEWPPAGVFDDAFVWFDLNAMKDSLLPRNEEEIDTFVAEKTRRLRRAAGPLEKERLLQQLIAFLEGLRDTAPYEKSLKELRRSRAFRQAQEDFNSLLLEEKGMEQYYMKHFGDRSFSWWRAEMDKLDRQAARSDGERRASLLRVKHFLSLVAYMQTERALKEHRAEAGDHLALYRLLDPENPDVWFFEAVMKAREGDTAAARQALEKARELGLSDAGRWRDWPVLAAMRNVRQAAK